MRILFISNDLIAGDIARILTNEGHSVKLFVQKKEQRRNLQGFVKKTENWENELLWVGKSGLIVFDDVGFGKIQNNLRKQGYNVVGGSALGDRLEEDREYGQDIFKKYGIKTAPLKDFDDIQEALTFVEKDQRVWVVKQNNHHYSKKISYVGELKDGRDVASYLRSNIGNPYLKNERISLHQRIFGVEIAAGRFFNGNDWVGPICINLEHTHLFPNRIGPLTSEMGTLAWYTENENNKLWKATTARLKPYLQEINFRGYIDINCIVNKRGAFALEATARFGSPIIHLQAELHKSPWGEFLLALAKGEQYDLKYNRGYGIVTLVAVPPFPYGDADSTDLLNGTQIFFDRMGKNDWKSVHFEEVSAVYKNKVPSYYISDNRGYVLYVTSYHRSLRKAQEKTQKLLRKIFLPKMMYREDIGSHFLREDKQLLKDLGYIKQDWHDKYTF
jgi:phosphoribosylamine---glycine ligase